MVLPGFCNVPLEPSLYCCVNDGTLSMDMFSDIPNLERSRAEDECLACKKNPAPIRLRSMENKNAGNIKASNFGFWKLRYRVDGSVEVAASFKSWQSTWFVEGTLWYRVSMPIIIT